MFTCHLFWLGGGPLREAAQVPRQQA